MRVVRIMASLTMLVTLQGCVPLYFVVAGAYVQSFSAPPSLKSVAGSPGSLEKSGPHRPYSRIMEDRFRRAQQSGRACIAQVFDGNDAQVPLDWDPYLRIAAGGGHVRFLVLGNSPDGLSRARVENLANRYRRFGGSTSTLLARQTAEVLPPFSQHCPGAPVLVLSNQPAVLMSHYAEPPLTKQKAANQAQRTVLAVITRPK